MEYELLSELIRQVKTGAFINVKYKNETNTMTIAWLTIGSVWNTDVVTVYVRDSRHTFELIEEIDSFTVSFPHNKKMLDKIAKWGKESGRDVKKLTDSNSSPAKFIDGVVVDDCNIHIECEIIYKQVMDPSALDKKLHDKFYPKKDYHTIYYGKIMGMYQE